MKKKTKLIIVFLMGITLILQGLIIAHSNFLFGSFVGFIGLFFIGSEYLIMKNEEFE